MAGLNLGSQEGGGLNGRSRLEGLDPLGLNTCASNVPASADAYAGGWAFEEFLIYLQHAHRFLWELICDRYKRPAGADDYVRGLNLSSWEFEGAEIGGRGSEYNRAQESFGNRPRGMRSLLERFGERRRALPNPSSIILDALAGNGVVQRFAKALGVQGPQIVSADISRLMIDSCIDQQLPCIRQSASESLLREDTLDGVLIAYGSHHLDAAERRRAAAEAFRTLKRGGQFVLHDFESGGPVDGWFRRVVHPQSITGHPHRHFSRNEMHDLLAQAGFREIDVSEMEDPFETIGTSADDARRNMLRHLHAMYGLARLGLETDDEFARLEAMVGESLGEIRVEDSLAGAHATLPRKALVVVGTK